MFGCAPSSHITSSGKLEVMVDPLAGSTRSEIQSSANSLCSKYNKGSAKNLRKTGGNPLMWYYYSFDCTGGNPKIAKKYSNNSSSTYSSSSSFSSTYNNSTPKLFYDSSTGGMKECNYVPTNGRCNSFKTYSSASYNKNTLFYDPSTDSMRPCLGTVTMTGKCTMFGLYKRSLGSKNQLFYDSKNNKMTTCRSVSVTGQCLALDLIPRTGSTGGTYIVDDPSNPYYKKVPRSSTDLIKLGNSMLSGSCTLGLNC